MCGDAFKSLLFGAIKSLQGLWAGTSAKAAAQKDNGQGVLLGRGLKHRDIAVGVMATNHFCSRGRLDREALRTDGDFAVAANCNARPLGEDVGPPRTAWSWA